MTPLPPSSPPKCGAFKVGDGFEAGVTIGPLIDEQGLAKVEEHVRDAVSKGAKVLTGGKRIEGAAPSSQPTILTGVDREHEGRPRGNLRRRSRRSSASRRSRM